MSAREPLFPRPDCRRCAGNRVDCPEAFGVPSSWPCPHVPTVGGGDPLAEVCEALDLARSWTKNQAYNGDSEALDLHSRLKSALATLRRARVVEPTVSWSTWWEGFTERRERYASFPIPGNGPVPVVYVFTEPERTEGEL